MVTGVINETRHTTKDHPHPGVLSAPWRRERKEGTVQELDDDMSVPRMWEPYYPNVGAAVHSFPGLRPPLGGQPELAPFSGTPYPPSFQNNCCRFSTVSGGIVVHAVILERVRCSQYGIQHSFAWFVHLPRSCVVAEGAEGFSLKVPDGLGFIPNKQLRATCAVPV